VSAVERWHFVRDGQLWRHEENDGIVFLRRGAEAVEEPLRSVAEAEIIRYPRELARARAEGMG
jgi:hypothetical protein